MRLFVCIAVLLVVAAAMPADVGELYKPHKEGFLCDICKDIVKDAEAEGSNYSCAWLKAKIKDLCSDLGFLASTCETALDSVVDDLDKYILAHATPEVCCQEIDMC